jgi:glycosyltransferase involved in cell wall biosynthesis
MNKKTIWVVNQFAGTPESGWGERHYYLSKYWIKKGYNVIVLAASYSHMFKNQPHIEGKRFTLEKIEDGITFCWVKIPKYKADGTASKLIAGLVFSLKASLIPKNIVSNPDFIIVSSPSIFSSISGWILKKRLKAKKNIFEIRDLWPLTPMLLKGYSKHHPVIIVMDWFQKIGYNKYNYIVSVLPNTTSYISKVTKKPKKIYWIPNGIDKRLLKEESLPDDIIKIIPKKKFIVGYTGTMGMANALEYFAQASRVIDNDDIHFVFVGDGYLKNKLKNLSNFDNTTFIDKINKNQVQNILKLFDVCFIGRNDTPLFNYGVSSNKYFDYMLAKKPILVSSNHIKDPVELSGCGIIVKPESAQAIKEGILYLYNLSEEERKEMGQKGYEYVTKFHNFDYLSDKYIKLFNND